MSNARKSITVKEDTHKTLWNLKEDPDHTYDEILRELLRDARDIEVRADEL
jgi:predicted CopG family antitoxin